MGERSVKASSVRYLTVDDAAAELGCHVETVRRMLRRGEMEGRKLGSSWRVLADDDGIRIAERVIPPVSLPSPSHSTRRQTVPVSRRVERVRSRMGTGHPTHASYAAT
jgi:excisionase family DNA binding protein